MVPEVGVFVAPNKGSLLLEAAGGGNFEVDLAFGFAPCFSVDSGPLANNL